MMGNPSSSDPSHSSPFPKSSARHRHSVSISSLPLEKLGKTGCESTNYCKRTSVSALSSPAKGVLTEPEKLSVASFLGHGGQQEPTPTIARRSRPASGNGHRRVGSGSNIATLTTSPSSKTTTTWDNFNYSPRAKSAAGNNVTTSVASTPSKKLDKHAAAKIAASPFYSPTNKLERSVSLSRVAHHRRPSTGQKCSAEQSTGIGSGGGENSCESSADLEERKTATRAMEKNHATDITEPVKDEEEASQQRIPSEDPGTCANTPELPSSPPLQEPSENATETMQQEESAHPARDVASTAGDESAHRLREISETNNMETAPDSPVSIATLFEEEDEETNPSTEGETNPGTEGETNPGTEGETNPGTEGETTPGTEGETTPGTEGEKNAPRHDNLHVLFATETQDPEKGSEAPETCDIISRIGYVSVEEEEEAEAQSSPVNKVTFSRRDECGNSSKRISVMKSAVRKRRRSQSASGIAAVLLRVVSDPESAAGHVVAVTSKRVLGSPEMISRVKSVIENAAAQSEVVTRPIHAARVVCQTGSEDAVKSTYSRFVDIEIDLGHGCVELVQHSKDVVQRCVVAQDGVDDTGWKRKQHPAASASRERLTVGKSPRHHPHVKVNTCKIHEGKIRQRKIKTMRRGRINSSDLDSLTEFLKTTNSFSVDCWTEFLKTTKSFSPLQDDTTATKPRPPSPPPPPPPPPPQQQQQQQQQSTTAPHQPPKQLPTVFISRLQAPTPASFSSYIDSSYRPGGCISSSTNVISAMSILAQSQPSFSFSSSSHQDKLWEEQADIYSSGGRGTPDRRESDVDGRIPDLHADFNLLHHHQGQAASQGSCGPAHSQQHHHQRHHQQYQQHHGAAMRRSGLSSGGGGLGVSENARNGHFMQQIMSRIRGAGSSPGKGAGGGCPENNNNYKAREMGLQSKRRNSSAWSSCICFSVKSS